MASRRDLHVETLTDDLGDAGRADYAAALACYDDAKAATTLLAVLAVETLLDDGRFARACVLARRDGRPLPHRREPCFFNPQHGPASRDLTWAPPGGVDREIPVCFGCAQRLTAGDPPDHRMVRQGDRWVPWYAAGGSLAELVGVDAHVVRGPAWTSRAHEAEALTRAAIQRQSGMGGG